MPYKPKLKLFPTTPGVYIFRNKNGKPLYVGKSINLKQRISSYFQSKSDLMEKTRLMVGKITKVEIIKTESELEALLLEADLIKRLTPKYNIQLKDDKRYKFIKISNMAIWPTVGTSRTSDEPKALYFGPFPEGRTINQVLKSLRRVFPWCKYKSVQATKRGRDSEKGCFYYQLGLCPGICANKISLKEYQKIINNLAKVLSGQSGILLSDWKKAMKKSAREQNFEDAAKFKSLIDQLNYITQTFRDSSEYLENPNLLADQRREETKNLIKLLKLPLPLSYSSFSSFRIEAFDISNIQNQLTTGSRVVFVGGEPQKNDYRRYRIRLDPKNLPNDIAAIQEVLARRFAKRPIANKPHLILIDGGKGQVNGALKVLKQKRIKIPVVGLAKKYETLIIPRHDGLSQDLSLGKLKLLQRVRDEAHRFALTYHRQLRRKKLFNKRG